MREWVSNVIRAIDTVTARAYLSLAREGPGLVTLLFHSLFQDAAEVQLGQIDPQQRTTVGDFAEVVGCFHAAGYGFVTPEDILNGLNPSGRHVMLTFDDGYYNNIRALPVLEKFNAPATFFISTGHVRDARCFWWDVLFRERASRGGSLHAIRAEGTALKSLTYAQIDEELAREFGSGAAQPRGDLDRPFTPAELREFARQPLVHLGNHTRNHAILTLCPVRDLEVQITGAQQDLHEMTGSEPAAIAYPNGNLTDEVVAAARRAGLKLGLTLHPAKNRLPLAAASGRAMRIARFTPIGSAKIFAQCRVFRSDLSLYGKLKRLAHW